jgi:hypothetical protein
MHARRRDSSSLVRRQWQAAYGSRRLSRGRGSKRVVARRSPMGLLTFPHDGDSRTPFESRSRNSGPGLVDGDRGPKVSQRPASNRSRKPRQALLFPPIRLSRLGAEDLRGVAARGVAGSCRRARHTVERRRSRGSSLVPDRDGVSAVERAAEASGVGGLRTARSGDTCAAEPGCCEEGRSDGQCPPHLSKGRRDPAAARSPLRRAGATRFG